MEFKGTKGKWRKFQLPNGNMKITCDDWREFAEIEFKHWQNTEERRKQCLYNALLISNAPEFLEEIQDTIDDLKLLKSTILDASKINNKLESVVEVIQNWIDRKEQLIKEATEL